MIIESFGLLAIIVWMNLSKKIFDCQGLNVSDGYECHYEHIDC